MRGILLLALLLSISAVGEAEMREWILTDETSIDAVYKSQVANRVILEDEDGKLQKIPIEKFSDADRLYIELENPPDFRINFKKKSSLKQYSNRFVLSDMPVVLLYEFGVGIEQRSAGEYNHELTVEFFAVAAQRRHNNKFVLVDRQSTTFTLNKANNRTFEFWSPRVAEIDEYTYRSLATRGKKYDAYLITITDSRGEVIAAETSNKWLLENIDTLKERSIGNYMDTTCKRVYPGRPKAVNY